MNLQMVSWLVQQHGSPGAVAYIVIASSGDLPPAVQVLALGED